jgi:hypothetical protein
MTAFRAYALLISITLALTFALVLAADAVSPRLWLGVLAVASLMKARLILFDYLGLRGVEGWRGGFMAGLVGLVVVVYALLAVG